MAVEGAGETTVVVRWEEGAELDAGARTVERPGAGSEGIEWSALGWETPLRTHRPFLSYAELGALVEKPSGLYDQLEGILGLEADLDALGRLLTGGSQGAGAEVMRRLQGLAQLRGPDVEAVGGRRRTRFAGRWVSGRRRRRSRRSMRRRWRE